jgi:hypothetical protein
MVFTIGPFLGRRRKGKRIQIPQTLKKQGLAKSKYPLEVLRILCLKFNILNAASRSISMSNEEQNSDRDRSVRRSRVSGSSGRACSSLYSPCGLKATGNPRDQLKNHLCMEKRVAI